MSSIDILDIQTMYDKLYNQYPYYLLKASKYLDENSRYEMLDVLTHLEGEIQAKDVTIAALKVRLREK
jgi:hypothetical protein